ncbi:MAG: patatin-like phospholipase family protein [Longispora sp.]|nr:patatin-like phospholipase family protein [Longispora sp. (in: high G+C Gram-positive bacteria)]
MHLSSRLAPPDVLVLGGGGPIGLAWQLGWLDEAAHVLGPEIPMIGTSAGAIAGALFMLGPQRRRAVMAALRAAATSAPQSSVSKPPPPPSGPELEAAMSACSFGDAAAISVIGRLEIQHPADDSHVQQVRDMVGEDWPAGDLAVVTRSVRTGERNIFRGTVSLYLAVAASSAVPWRTSPVVIDGEEHIDGGLGSILNADLAQDVDTIWVLAPAGLGAFPLRTSASKYLQREIAALRASHTRVELFTPKSEFPDLGAFADVIRAMDDGARVARTWLGAR